MDGFRNQKNFGFPANNAGVKGVFTGVDMHDDLFYTITSRSYYYIQDLNGTVIDSGRVPILIDSVRGITIHDGKMWIAKDYRIISYDLKSGQTVSIDTGNNRLYGITDLDGVLYVLAGNTVRAYDTDGTHLLAKSFALDPVNSNADGIEAEETTGTLWVNDYNGGNRNRITYVYSAADDDGTRHLLFRLKLDHPNVFHEIAITPAITSYTITVPAGTDATAYYYHAPANEDVTHTVQAADHSADPPATITTRRDVVIPPPVQIFHDAFDSSLGLWAYQERSYGSLNSMFCGTDDVTDAYTLAQSGENGGSARVENTGTCWFGLSGASRTFDVPIGHDGDLSVTLDYRTQADFGNQTIGGHANNLFYAVTDLDGNDLDNGSLFLGKRHKIEGDSHWDTAMVSVPSLMTSSCPCKIFVYTTDLGWDVYNKRFFFDNVNATMSP